MNKNPRQENNLYKRRRIFILVMIYLLIVIIFANISYGLITSDIKRELGNKAMLLAIDIAGWLDIDGEEFDRLLSLDFYELLQDPVNVEFEKRVRRLMDYSEIKYIYLQTLIPEDFVKYRVEEGEEDIYEMEVGTPLKVTYLLDAVVDEETRLEDTAGKGYVNKDRYTVLLPSFKEVYDSQKPTYRLMKDRWGIYIIGYAPYYDRNGNYLGLIGVDLILDAYSLYLRKNFIVITVFTSIFIFMGLYALSLVLRLWGAEEREKKERQLSNTDSLTGLLNRRQLTKYLTLRWQKGERQGTPIAMLIIDVDYFKEYNDNYGHRLGDKILCKIASVLVKEIRQSVDFVGRYGGDEFIVVLDQTDAVSAEKIANRMMKGVRNLYIQHEYSHTRPYVTISVGVASILPSKDLTTEDLMDRADEALYYAKNLGRNCVQVWKENIAKEMKDD